ncbi:MAG: EF-hand domain-containing protein [Alsobacter sp.]
MVPALGIAASLLSDIGFKAIKGLASGQKSQSTTQEGITDQSAATGQNVPAKSTRPDISQLFSKIDADGNGTISKEEFLAFKAKIDSAMSALLKTQEDATKTSASSDASSTDQTSLADQLFSKLDANNDGTLSQDELNSVMSHGRRHGHHGGVGNFMNALLELQSQSSSSTSATTSAAASSVTSTSGTSGGATA